MSFDFEQPSYRDLRAILAEGTSPVIAWTGAGLSRPAGMPSWSDLKERLLTAWEHKVRSMNDDDREAQKVLIGRARDDRDYWVAMQKISDGIGAASFRDAIRAALSEAHRARIPKAYAQLWQLRIGGMVNLNLDRLATRAFIDAHGNEAPLEFSGFQVGNLDVLKHPRRFIANLHGHYEDHTTWILTKVQLGGLAKNKGYQNFIDSCIKSRTILFLGIGADDIAVGGHLERMSHHGINTGTHFWITDRGDSACDAWAEKNGIRLVRYTPSDEDHSVLCEILTDLGAYVPEDEVAPPVVLSGITANATLPPATDLAREDADTIRRSLNAHATRLLGPETTVSYAEYERFCGQYDEAIYRAWYTALEPPSNRVLGYELEASVGKGAFGTVYRAQKDGKTVALKILNLEVRRQPDMLQSFRRGVRSMKILQDAGVDRMVPYLDASEIPALVVMDWIEGPNLRDVVMAGQIDDWPTKVEIAVALAQTIRTAHSLPQRVLHRDLRPSNVMLRDYYSSSGPCDVVVLDFDLSWHLGAHEKTAMVGADTTGYLAPEQLQRLKGVSTRHASVDAFGLGMTMFFMVSKRDPFPTEHNHKDWEVTVRRAVRLVRCDKWRSLPERYARAILACTRNTQSERWDMAQLEGELERLSEAVTAPDDVVSAEMLAEELTARTKYGDSYRWDDNRLHTEIELPSGIAVCIGGSDAEGVITADIGWTSAGQHSRKRVMKWLPSAGERVESCLSSVGWQMESSGSWGGEIHFVASFPTTGLHGKLSKVAGSLDEALTHLHFD